MLKKLFAPAKGVSNIELFYDLIFVYCISVVTGVLHHPAGGFFDVETYALYAVDMFTILQVWFFTTFLQNRYGDGWRGTMLTWNLVWAFILIDLLVHWGIKRFRYSNLDDVDRRIMDSTMLVLGVQAAIVLVAAFLPWEIGQWVSLAAFAFGWLAFAQGGRLADKPARFDHLAERCALLVIVTFGETVVGIAGYMEGSFDLVFALLVFALVVGLFLVYFFEHDYMLDHHRDDAGIGFMLLTAILVFVIGNVTVALEYLPEGDVLPGPKSLYLAAGLCAYMLSSFIMFRYNKPQFRITGALVASRVAACAVIVAVAALSGFDPLVMLACNAAVVWAALAAEYVLYRKRRETDEGRLLTEESA